MAGEILLEEHPARSALLKPLEALSLAFDGLHDPWHPLKPSHSHGFATLNDKLVCAPEADQDKVESDQRLSEVRRCTQRGFGAHLVKDFNSVRRPIPFNGCTSPVRRGPIGK